MSIPQPTTLSIHTETLLNGLSFNMVRVDGGNFLLEDKIETHISTFYMGQYPVTQALWEAVMGENRSAFKGGNLPVENVSWYDAVQFCNTLSELQGLDPAYQIDKTIQDPNNKSEEDRLRWLVSRKKDANGYCLPTEAMWEFAARGGNYGMGYRYSGGDQLDKVEWYRENSHFETQPVGLLAPNELGIFDLSGNVFEWCGDWSGGIFHIPIIDSEGPSSGHYRVRRGGSWIDNRDGGSKVTFHDHFTPSYLNKYVGFRLAKTAL